MDKTIQTALSGITAQQAKMDVTSHNIANVNTDTYHAYRVTLHEAYPSGVAAQIDQPGSLGYQYTKDGGSAVEGSNVDLAQEMLNLMDSENSIKACVELIKSQDQIIGTVLDIFH